MRRCCWRHGGWYAPLVTLQGEETRDRSAMAAAVVARRRGNIPVVVDMGDGHGTDMTSRPKENGIAHVAFNGANKPTGGWRVPTAQCPIGRAVAAGVLCHRRHSRPPKMVNVTPCEA
jgi:hypothetical protein